MSEDHRKSSETPAEGHDKTNQEALSEEDLAYVSEHLSEDVLDDIAGGEPVFGEAG